MNRIVCVTVALVLAGCEGAAEKGASRDGLSNDIAQTLTFDAKGCLAKGPDGKLLQLTAPAGGQILIPRGSSFPPECFKEVDKNADR